MAHFCEEPLSRLSPRPAAALYVVVFIVITPAWHISAESSKTRCYAPLPYALVAELRVSDNTGLPHFCEEFQGTQVFYRKLGVGGTKL